MVSTKVKGVGAACIGAAGDGRGKGERRRSCAIDLPRELKTVRLSLHC